MIINRIFCCSISTRHLSVTILFTPTATPSTNTVSNVLINPSLIGSKNILITTSMVSQNSSESLKRKHEEDDDYDALWWGKNKYFYSQPSLDWEAASTTSSLEYECCCCRELLWPFSNKWSPSLLLEELSAHATSISSCSLSLLALVTAWGL